VSSCQSADKNSAVMEMKIHNQYDKRELLGPIIWGKENQSKDFKLKYQAEAQWSPDTLVKSNPSLSSFSHLARPGGALISPVCWKKWYGFTWTRLGAKFHTSSLSSMIHTKLSPQGKRALSRAQKDHLQSVTYCFEAELNAKVPRN